jgi:flagellar hook-associated protein 1 FlgK
MSLFSAVQTAATSLQVTQLGLQTVGNNIANANTPGYIRQQVIQTPAVGYRYGSAVIGLGVRAQSVEQVVDESLLTRLRKATGELAFQEQVEFENVNQETMLNELTDRDFSSMLNRFTSSFQEIANQPGSEAVKQLALRRGQEIATQLQSISREIQQGAAQARVSVQGAASDINRLTNQIGDLNMRIVEIEGGMEPRSSAVGLRDARIKALEELSALVDINAAEQADSTVTVFIGGDLLLSSNLVRQVKAQALENDPRGIELRFVDTDSQIPIAGGKVAGLYQTANPSRADGLLAKIDDFARSIIRVVNSIHSQGQGSRAFQSTVGEVAIENPAQAIEKGNPDFDIQSGSFWITISDERTSSQRSIEIPITQLGLTVDTTSTQVVAAIDAINGLSASFTSDGRVEIKSDSPAIRFSFSKDTSGVLSAFGINTFFKGSSSADIEVRPLLLNDPSLFAVSSKGVGVGADNALAIATAFTEGHPALDGRSINDVYQTMYGEAIRNINEQKGITNGLRDFHQALESEHLRISGVDLDEEAVKMMQYQRSFQATGKLISTISDLLETLINLV